MAVPLGTESPQKVAWETFVVVVGAVSVNPLTVTALPVSAVEVPAYVKLEVE